MMKIYFSPYVLRSSASLGAKRAKGERHGALLRVEKDGAEGFADLHPWPELGDLSLDLQLEGLRENRSTPLTRSSLALADLDRQARARGVSAFDELVIPRSHFLVTDLLSSTEKEWQEALRSGFDTIKIKIGVDLKSELDVFEKHADLLSRFRLRLDVNASLGRDALCEFFKRLPTALWRAVEFVEDPLPWNPNTWSEFAKEFSTPLALDRFVDEPTPLDLDSVAKVCQWVVIKPACQNEEVWHSLFSRSIRATVTSYLDHPVGQMGAALVAARLFARVQKSETCGLLSHRVYEPNAFSLALNVKGPELFSQGDIGIGFTDLLQREKWRPL